MVGPETAADVAADLRVQTYEGEPVLTWWEGQSAEGRGAVSWSSSIAGILRGRRLRTGDGLDADFHEFRLTDEGTALLIAYGPEPADLSTVGGPQRGFEFENYVQEVDVATGEVLLEWSAGDHVPVSDTFSELTDREDGSEDRPLDWFHANSVAPGPDGTLLVSARNTHTIYAIDRATGEVRGASAASTSDIAMGPGAAFQWQHDAEWLRRQSHQPLRQPRVDDRRRAVPGAHPRRRPRARTAARSPRSATPDGVSAGTQGNTRCSRAGACSSAGEARGASPSSPPPATSSSTRRSRRPTPTVPTGSSGRDSRPIRRTSWSRRSTTR